MSIFLTAEWRKLIMAQYVVKPTLLTPYLPSGLELDLFHGSCYVSLVGFIFDHVRLKGVPIPFHTRFEEINLRFYVRRTEPDGTQKRGVVFIREFVPRTAITCLANALYEEPYATLPTQSSIDSTARSLNVQYSWRQSNRWHSLAVEASPSPQPIAVGTEEEFLTEHYWGYTKRSNGTTSEYEVKHPRWQTYPVRQATVDAGFAELYGSGFTSLNAQQPASVLLAEGSAVSVHSGSRLSA
ncbi:MAG: DUF2071 domain-containing protein [Acidobacteriaceae bacterium]